MRVADRFELGRLAALHEEHTTSGAHRVREEAFPRWVPADVRRAAEGLAEEEALAALPAWLIPV